MRPWGVGSLAQNLIVPSDRETILRKISLEEACRSVFVGDPEIGFQFLRAVARLEVKRSGTRRLKVWFWLQVRDVFRINTLPSSRIMFQKPS